MKSVQYFIVVIFLYFLASCTTNTKTVANKDSLYRILVGEKYGFINEKGRIIIEPQFDDAYTMFTDGVCFARIGDRRGLIDETGAFIKEYADSVRYVSNFVGGVSRIDCGYGQKGIINRNGDFLVPACQYDVRVNEDEDNFFYCIEGADDDKDWFITDDKGVIIGQKCDSILSGFCNGLCAIKINDKWGYMDRNGNIVIDTVYDYVRIFTKDGIARVRKGEEQFYIDKAGNKLFDVDQTLSGFICNRAAVVIGGNKYLVDRTGNKICSLDADRVGSFRTDDNLATIIKDGYASLIDTMGNIVLSTHYDNIGSIIGGVAPFWIGGKVGFIDSSGKEIIGADNEQYISALHDKESNIRAVQSDVNGYWARTYYDLHGNLIWQDSPVKKVSIPYNPSRKDFVDYYDAKLAELDPIEGIYYVTDKNYYQDRDNLSQIGLNKSSSEFYAVVWNELIDGYEAKCVDESNMRWVNKFVKIGNTDTYAIMKIDKDNDYSSEGRVTIEDFNQFEFRLDQDHNNWYNYFVTYEFVRDYPPLSEIEKVMKAEWTGSGFAIADGYIVTNYHVTSGAKTIRVKGIKGNMEESYSGFVVTSDKDHDISVIKIVDKDFEGFGPIPYSIGKATVEMGDDVFVLGYPMTLTMGEEVKLTEGIISSTSGYKGDESMYQVSAAVQPGNSGGPLFNSDGAVIGIVCGKHADAENANYAVKVSYLYSLISSSNLGIDISGNNHINGRSLSNKVKKIKDYVYYIECSSR